MKTKWGSCNADARRIWLNLELAKKPVQCLEYIVVHELTHLLERHHNDRFTSLMDRHLPHWRQARKALNERHLAMRTGRTKSFVKEEGGRIKEEGFSSSFFLRPFLPHSHP